MSRMRKRAPNKYSLLACVSLLLLCACEQLEMGAGTEQMSASESEQLRRNGNALIESGKPQDAIILFDKLIESDRQNALAYNGKAVAFDYSGNHLAAQELYKTALSLSPDSTTIRNNLAMSMILNNQIGQATKLLESLVKNSKDANPMSHIIRHNLALAYGLSGQHEKATKLNLRDMTKKQAEDNVAFYKQYSVRGNAQPSSATQSLKGKKNKKTDTPKEQNIGFITSPPAAPAVPSVAKNAKSKNAKSVAKGAKTPTKTPLSDKINKADKADIFSGLINDSMNYDYPK